MSNIDVGSRKLIRNTAGQVVGTVIPSKKFPGKMTHVQILPSGDQGNVLLHGPIEWAKKLEENPDWTLEPSYFLCKCEYKDGIITILLVHNSVPSWNTIRMVPMISGWSTPFLEDWKTGQIKMGRETHIGNRYDLSV
jgi:hypothetical protein